MASSRSGLFCAAFDCNNNKSVQKVRDLFRFQKEQFVIVYRKRRTSGGLFRYSSQHSLRVETDTFTGCFDTLQCFLENSVGAE